MTARDFMAPAFRLFVEGHEVGEEVTQHVVEIDVEHTVDVISKTSIVVQDADNRWTDSILWEPGNEVDVFMGYGNALGHVGRFEILRHLPDYPEDALAFRGGYERCGDRIATVRDSFDLEALILAHPETGTWVVDEAAFYDERIAYLMRNESERRGLVFVCPTLILNFRREIFNPTARLLVETATDVYPLTAYCEHQDCIEDSFYTYRYYLVGGRECPALYFDPLIIVGGDREKDDPREPNYCTRCDAHHYLPGKEYTFFTLKPLGEAAGRGDLSPLREELALMHGNIEKSLLFGAFRRRYLDREDPVNENMAALEVPCIAERALCYLFAEQNLVSADQTRSLAKDLDLDADYLSRRLADNRRPIPF